MAALMATGFDEARLSSYQSIVQSFPLSASSIGNCASGTYLSSSTNPDGVLSVGDSIKDEAKNCTSINPPGLQNITETETVTAVSGPTNDAKGVFSLTTSRSIAGNSEGTEVIAGISYRRVFNNFSLTSTTAYGQDGKSTLSTGDDVYSESVTSKVSASGTVNGAPISLTGSTSTACSRIGAAAVVCSKFDSALAGNILSGAINATGKVATPLQFSNTGQPIGGSLLISQGTDTATAEFSLVGTVPTVKVTSGGVVQTFTYAELNTLSDTLF
jgi:hypothetical protein